jgi:hypothetical protein
MVLSKAETAIFTFKVGTGKSTAIAAKVNAHAGVDQIISKNGGTPQSNFTQSVKLCGNNGWISQETVKKCNLINENANTAMHNTNGGAKK